MTEQEINKAFEKDKRKKVYHKKCKICKKDFTTTKSNVEYDSDVCRRKRDLIYQKNYFKNVLKARRRAKKTQNTFLAPQRNTLTG